MVESNDGSKPRGSVAQLVLVAFGTTELVQLVDQKRLAGAFRLTSIGN